MSMSTPTRGRSEPWIPERAISPVAGQAKGISLYSPSLETMATVEEFPKHPINPQKRTQSFPVPTNKLK